MCEAVLLLIFPLRLPCETNLARKFHIIPRSMHIKAKFNAHFETFILSHSQVHFSHTTRWWQWRNDSIRSYLAGNNFAGDIYFTLSSAAPAATESGAIEIVSMAEAASLHLSCTTTALVKG